MTRCASPLCVTNPDGTKGREFTPPTNAQGVNLVWCPACLRTAQEMEFFTLQTAQMIRGVYKSYIDTELPKEVKLFLEQYTVEILRKLNQQL